MNKLLEYRPREVSEAIENARRRDSKTFFKLFQNSLVTRCCPVCRSRQSRHIDAYGGGFPVCICMDCSMLYAPYIITGEALQYYYENSESSKLLGEFYSKRLPTSKVQSLRSEILLGELQKLYNLHKRRLRVLEIGCGDGSFIENLLLLCNKAAIPLEITGIDANRNLITIAHSRNINAHHWVAGTTPLHIIAEQDSYDVIFFFELIEHLPDPTTFMKECGTALKSDGVIVLTTPNADGFENILTGCNGYRLLAHAIAPPAHINAFSYSNLKLFLYLNGFTNSTVIAKGNFDAAALQCYLAHDPSGDWITPELVAAAQIEPDSLQYIINMMNGSSTMYAITSKRQK